jgi:two-component system cell cycle sensor histidine kinase/response regulator CckA
MDGETLSNVFEPFFSAKGSGRSGLGLSILYGIVKQSGGGVRVSSEPEEGTTVKVFLPRAEGDEASSEDDPASLRGGETVLVVEDEDGVRELLSKVLTGHGHTVLEARHGQDALTVVSGYSHPIHLVVTDVVMPVMGASEMVDQLAAERPDLKVLYISGYTNDEIMRRGVGGLDAPVVRKPFTSDDLMRKVREVLDGKA